MKTTNRMSSARRARACVDRRRAFTVVELLVVIGIITLLMTLLFPALTNARRAGQDATCKSNLRQLGIGLMQYSGTSHRFCSGAFDWLHDGCVTEVGWVADLVNSGIPVGKMLCPGNENKIAQTYNDLLQMANPGGAEWDSCGVTRLGSQPRLDPAGATVTNPCRTIAQKYANASDADSKEARRQHVETAIFKQHYNTNYTASWVLVRSGVLLDESGNVRNVDAGTCPEPLKWPRSTWGPLRAELVESADMTSAFIPLLGCGGPAAPLVAAVGTNTASSFTVKSMTNGPVLSNDMAKAPGGIGTTPYPAGTPKSTWWAEWRQTLQDYRGFAPVHRDSCNVLFADGGVRGFVDQSKDGLLNNGFAASPSWGFNSSEIELPREEFYNDWSLRGAKY